MGVNLQNMVPGVRQRIQINRAFCRTCSKPTTYNKKETTMPRKQEAQHQISTTGVFHSVPAIFENGPEGIKHVLKIDFATTIEDAEAPNFTFKTAFSTRHVLLDFSAIQPSTIDLKRIER